MIKEIGTGIITLVVGIPFLAMFVFIGGIILMTTLFGVGFFWANVADFAMQNHKHEMVIKYCNAVHADCRDIRSQYEDN